MRFNFTKHLSSARKRNVNTDKANIFWIVALIISTISVSLLIASQIK